MKSEKNLSFLATKSTYFLLIVIGILSTYDLGIAFSRTLSGIDLALAIIISISTIINILNKRCVSVKMFTFFCCIFFSLILSLMFKSYSITLLYLCGISAVNFSPKELIKIYFYSTLVGICISAVLGLFGIVSFSNVGFTNKNLMGFYLFSECLLYLCLNPKVKKSIKYFLLIMLFFVEFFILKDRTAGILSIVYLIIILNNEKNRTVKGKAIIILPFVLAITSIFLGKIYSLNNNWINNLNKILSNRLLFWNFNLNQYGIKFFPQKVVTTTVLLNDGSFTTNFLDNGYLNFLIGIGFFQTIILLLIICIAIKNIIIQDKYNELLIIVIFLLFAFTEKIIFSPTCCILFPLCFSIIKLSYMNERIK